MKLYQVIAERRLLHYNLPFTIINLAFPTALNDWNHETKTAIIAVHTDYGKL